MKKATLWVSFLSLWESLSQTDIVPPAMQELLWSCSKILLAKDQEKRNSKNTRRKLRYLTI